jgi:hypothetical protein
MLEPTFSPPLQVQNFRKLEKCSIIASIRQLFARHFTLASLTFTIIRGVPVRVRSTSKPSFERNLPVGSSHEGYCIFEIIKTAGSTCLPPVGNYQSAFTSCGIIRSVAIPASDQWVLRALHLHVLWVEGYCRRTSKSTSSTSWEFSLF